MSDLVYAGAVVFGASTLLIEAFRNFNSQANQQTFALSPILVNVQVRNLCTSGEIIAGFILYAVFYLLAYAIILGSTEVFELLISAMQARDQIGATEGDALLAQDPISEATSDYGKPVLVSALIIASLSIGIVRQAEATLRTLAHRIAGIPRGVYKVMDALRNAPFEDFASGHSRDLTQRFRAKVKLATQARMSNGKYSDQIKDIEYCLTTIDCLSRATSTEDSTLYFPQHKMAALVDLSEALTKEINALSDEVDNLPEPDPANPGAVSASTFWSAVRKIEENAVRVRSNTVAVFSVLYVRNNRSVLSRTGSAERRNIMKLLTGMQAPPETPIDRVRVWLRQSSNIDQNAFAMAVVVAAVLGAVIIYSTYAWWQAGISRDDFALNQYISRADKPLEQTLDACRANPTCIDAASSSFVERQIPIILTATVWDVLHATAIVVLSVLFTLIGREIRVDEQSWPLNWSVRDIPFVTILGLAVVPACLAVLAAGTVALARMGWDINFQFTQSLLIQIIEGSGAFVLLQAGSGIILSFGTVVILDRHESTSALNTMFAALIFLALYVVYTRFTIFVTYGGGASVDRVSFLTRPMRETIILSVVPALFLLALAGLLEWSETRDP